MHRAARTLALVFVSFLCAPKNARGASADPTFGSRGALITRINHQPGRYDAGQLVGFRRDGSLLIFGAAPANSSSSHLVIVNVDDSGRPVPGFGVNGTLDLYLGWNDGPLPIAVAPLPDGTLLVALSGGANAYVVKITDDGKLVTRFGQSGLARVQLVQGLTISTIGGMAPTQDGGAILSGVAVQGTYQSLLVRIDSEGKPMSSFGKNGVAYLARTTALHGGIPFQLPDGRFRVFQYGRDGERSGIAVTQALRDGQLDTSYGVAGTRFHAFTTAFQDVHEVQQLSDGSYYVSGTCSRHADQLYHYLCLSHFAPDGAADTAYAENGTRFIEFPDGGRVASFVASFGLDRQERPILFGTVAYAANAPKKIGLTRLNHDGSTDQSFGDRGYLLETGGVFYTNRGAVDPQGRVVVTGGVYDKHASSQPPWPIGDFITFRFLP